MNNSRLVIDDGEKYWFIVGTYKLHRIDGPSVIYPNDHMGWHINNKKHRIDGPAAVYIYGHKYWYLDDVLIRKFSFD